MPALFAVDVVALVDSVRSFVSTVPVLAIVFERPFEATIVGESNHAMPPNFPVFVLALVHIPILEFVDPLPARQALHILAGVLLAVKGFANTLSVLPAVAPVACVLAARRVFI